MASSSDRLLPGVLLLFSLSAQLVPESAPSTVTVLAQEERSSCFPAKSRLSGEETENNNKNTLKHILAKQLRPLFTRRRKQVTPSHPPPALRTQQMDARLSSPSVWRLGFKVSSHECDLLSCSQLGLDASSEQPNGKMCIFRPLVSSVARHHRAHFLPRASTTTQKKTNVT